MKFKKELDQIRQYIDNFDASEFSSSEDLDDSPPSREMGMARAKKIKARLGRKRQMEETFRVQLETHVKDETEIMITQEEIDALLESI